MRSARALVATDPRQFGRASGWRRGICGEPGRSVSDEIKLFGSTFVAGFLFVSILIG